ncbi:MAG: two-component regulator propeller domain-containing protein [Planctomycetota bacterium]
MPSHAARRTSPWSSCGAVTVLCAVLAANGLARSQELLGDPYFTATGVKTSTHMPRVIVRNMREDQTGNIWFATFGGPIRYDGKTFTNFGEDIRMPRTRIFSLSADHTGALWFGSIASGVARFDGEETRRFTKEPASLPKDVGGLPDNDVLWLFEDKDHNVWFGSNHGATCFDGESLRTFTTKQGLPHNSVYAIAQDGSGRLWFGTRGGVCSYDGKTFTDLTKTVGRTFENVRAVAIDKKERLWFGCQGGAFRYDGKELRAFDTQNGLLQDFVGSLLVDSKGNVWMGHPGGFPDFEGGGATRFDGTSTQQFTTKNGLTLRTVYSLLEDAAGNIWFGSAGDGVCRFDGEAFTNMSAGAPTK